jgi:hypothetical protein
MNTEADDTIFSTSTGTTWTSAPVASPTARQLTLPTFDGLTVDTWELAFSGKVALDQDFESDSAFIARCKLGQRVRITVEGTIVARPFALRVGGAETDDAVAAGAKLRVESVILEDE